jgi:hypothetical protein
MPTKPGTALVHLRPLGAAAGLLLSLAGATAAAEPFASILPPSGNRFVAGTFDLRAARAADIPVASTPVWVVGMVAGSGEATVWLVALADGAVRAFSVAKGGVAHLPVQGSLLPGEPPVLGLGPDGMPVLLRPTDGSGGTPLAVINPLGGGRYATTGASAIHVLGADGRASDVFAGAPLPDGRIVISRHGLFAAYSQPTERYPHGVSGDRLEAGAIALLEPERAPILIAAPGAAVFEGLAPLWADLDADGEQELVATMSDADRGARVVVYDRTGASFATGKAIGRGFRWRHVIAVGPFGPGGEIEVVEVVMPHLAGIVQFSRLQGTELVAVASRAGFTSHVLGSRNLEMAAGGDFLADGAAGLLVPTRARDTLAYVQRDTQNEGVVVRIALAVDGQIATNLGIAREGTRVRGIAVGRTDGILRVWQ